MRTPSLCSHFVFAAMLTGTAISAHAGWLDKPVPQWGLDAAKTHTPDYVGDAASVILFDEIVDTVDAKGGITQHERKALRILKPQGRDDAYCSVHYDVDEKVNYLREWPSAPTSGNTRPGIRISPTLATRVCQSNSTP